MRKHGLTNGYVGIEYVKALTGKSSVTIWRMIGTKRIPEPQRDGLRLVWKQTLIDRWIQRGEHLKNY